MDEKIPLSLGLVGSRAYEMQAWRSHGAAAVEEAVWGPPTSTPVAEFPERSWLRRPLEALVKVWSALHPSV